MPLLALAVLWALGWWRLWRRGRPAAAWRPAAGLVGLAALGLALLSPLDGLAAATLTAHMVQHLLLISAAAPALLLADPFPAVVWALPGWARRRAGRVVGRRAPAGRLWRAATAMGPAWLGFAAVLWLWHLPGAYDAALSHRLVHDLEHVSFWLAALAFWWPVVHPAPRVRPGAAYPVRVVYVALGALSTAALGMLLTLAPRILYRSYAASPGALEDQAWAGVAMWGLGGLVDMVAVLALVYRSFGATPINCIQPDTLTRLSGDS